MAMGLPYGLQAMLKEGHKHFSGVEEAVMKNIDACKALSQITRTSLGPNGMYDSLQATALTPLCGQGPCHAQQQHQLLKNDHAPKQHMFRQQA